MRDTRWMTEGERQGAFQFGSRASMYRLLGHAEAADEIISNLRAERDEWYLRATSANQEIQRAEAERDAWKASCGYAERVTEAARTQADEDRVRCIRAEKEAQRYREALERISDPHCRSEMEIAIEALEGSDDE